MDWIWRLACPWVTGSETFALRLPPEWGGFSFSAEDVPTLATARVEALEEVAAWL